MLSGGNSVNPTFTLDQTGAYGVELVVTDDEQKASAPATVLITTNPIPPVAVAGGAQKLAAGGTVQLNGSQSVGRRASYQWALLSVPSGAEATLAMRAA